MLSESLTALEEHGLIERTVVEQKPVRVEYSLTDGGRALETVLESMVEWGGDNLERPGGASSRNRPVVESRHRSQLADSEGVQ